MAGISLISHCVDLPGYNKLVIVQVAVICGNTEVVAHILTTKPLFTGQQGLVKFFAMTSTNDTSAGITE